MESKIPNTNEMCIAPGITHNIEFRVAAFGQHSFQCILCGLYFDEAEDSSG